MQRAVAMRDAAGRKGHVDLEASGGVTLETVRPIAATGVERISVGAVTHSVPAMDIGLEIESGD
jgi:nicotinate-nucleotide pyrophosphorylase (carboxylating)